MWRNGATLFNQADRISKTAIWQVAAGQVLQRQKSTRIEEMIHNDHRVTLREISSELGLSYGSVQHIVSDVLRYSKTVL
ncbi:hypothetical protein TNCV_1114301 [Trichonephila clavipes]|nr:hypothetical protein TNCV_1114301 [Trichonephila clavipes]